MQASSGREAVTSFLTARLPDHMFSENASFSCFARTLQDGWRVILSVECPFHDKSILEIGTNKDKKEVYATAIACSDRVHASSSIDSKKWTHVALVWNASSQALQLYVNGTLARMTALDKSEKLAFVKSTKTWRLVLGRGKSGGKTTQGWDGEVRCMSPLS